jgi:copper chaperone CopZ
MFKTTVRIDGMMCGMCEAHICDVIRKTFEDAKKVSASHKKGTASFVSENIPDETKLKDAITATGYTYISLESEEYKKKGLFR